MTTTTPEALYLLAFDHRDSFRTKLLGIQGTPSPEQEERIREAKRLIFAGFRRALEQGVTPNGAGILVDEQYGAEIAREAHAMGVGVAMPVEKSGQPEFDFEYGERFGDHIEAFDPAYAKVLVRYNPEGDETSNLRQLALLARLSRWLREHDRSFLFELLVPAEPSQLGLVDGDPGRYDRELRPGLMIRAVHELQAAGVEPDIWKIEGLDAREDCQRLAEATRAGGRDHVRCVVLGRGGDEARVIAWLRAGSGVPGYIGFAVGRTIWWDALTDWLAGGDPDKAVDAIGSCYQRLVSAYAGG